MNPSDVTDLINQGPSTPFDQLLKFLVLCLLVGAPLWFRHLRHRAVNEAKRDHQQMSALISVIEKLSQDAKRMAEMRDQELSELSQYRSLVSQYERDISALRDQIRAQAEREAESERQVSMLREQVNSLQQSLQTLAHRQG